MLTRVSAFFAPTYDQMKASVSSIMTGPGAGRTYSNVEQVEWIRFAFWKKKSLKIYISIDENISKGDVKEDVETTF